MPLLHVLLCCTLLSSAPAPERPWGEDKIKHLVASFVATSVSASAARAAGLERRASLYTGVAVGSGVGVWKELRDARRPQAASSALDLVWDVGGIVAAAVLLSQAR